MLPAMDEIITQKDPTSEPSSIPLKEPKMIDKKPITINRYLIKIPPLQFMVILYHKL